MKDPASLFFKKERKVKNIFRFLTIAAALLLSGSAQARTLFNGTIANDNVAFDQSYTFDMGSSNGEGADRVSSQMKFSSVTFTSLQFTDGVPATGNFRVITPSVFTAQSATETVTVVSTNGLSGAFLYFNGYPLREGIEWTRVNTTTGVANALTTAINTYIPGVAASSSSAVITVTVSQTGVGGNSYTCTSSTPTALSVASANFINGRNAVVLRIGQYTLTAGVNFTPVATATGTAKAISDAIVASPTFSTIVTSTWAPNGVVYATATAAGLSTNYPLESSNPSALQASAAQMSGGLDTAENLTGSYITKTSHGLCTGLPVLFTTQTAYAFSPLTWGTTYYVVKLDANHIQLATTKANASAATPVPVVFTSSSAAGGHTFTLSPLAISGTPVLKWQASNDGTYFTDIQTSTTTTISSYTNPYDTAIQDFGVFNFRYLRLAVTAPSTGALNLLVAITAKN
jgi:hypothetical protein